MIIWFGLFCLAVGILIGIWYGRIGYEPIDPDEVARQELRRELMDDGSFDQEDVGGAV